MRKAAAGFLRRLLLRKLELAAPDNRQGTGTIDDFGGGLFSTKLAVDGPRDGLITGEYQTGCL